MLALMPELTVAVLGAGPRGVGWLERFVENLRAGGLGQGAAAAGIRIVLIDPYQPGPGRLWRYDQSPLLKLNSLAADVTMFTDASCTVEGPIVPGPSLAEWAELWRAGSLDVTVDDEAVRAELEALGPASFPTRRLQSFYLDWFHRRTLANLPAGVEVEWLNTSAVSVADDGDRQLVGLADGGAVPADAVLYALGHNGSTLAGEHEVLDRFAREHGAYYLAPAFTADADLDGLPAGADIIVRGMGLAAVDLVVLLTQGRGGRFEETEGGLRYVPSGREPRLHLGSRRGVPYHSKVTSKLVAPRAELRFFTRDIAAVLGARADLDFAADVWPLIAKEALHGYYHELFLGHPDRVRLPWDEFLARFAELDPWSDALRELAVEALVDPADALDLSVFDRPLAGLSFASHDELQRHLVEYIADDVHRRTAAEHSATLGLFTSLLFALFATGGSGIEVPPWFKAFFSYVASGPPVHRLEELLALVEAGVVRFLGAELEVRADGSADGGAGVFRASSPSVPGELTSNYLVDAWLPEDAAHRSENAALRDAVRASSGEASLAALVAVHPDDSRLIGPDGEPHAARFAIGPFTSAPNAGAFARPSTDAMSFRENDRVARAVLRLLDELTARQTLLA
ncbi:adenylate cyclase [Gryllotalpicola protaetiae]|uniref:Adenylate cyclase n=2 Tax=Gryllotalpicola protaetiae TaxID=2419771 RepID=A0A387BJ02_9MICO|nr:adenylate cyclase [Gryllotalpicola protaetiae]